ncbi:MAG TPA: hypothetical protein VFG83_07110 [Kofleriaceae bacterium]|nr:hypothetical protein [Kofleriaceae bacterium]
MNAQQVSVKIFADPATAIDQDALIPIFHRWIRERKLFGHTLIDVADYRHVHHGPGVMIVAHEAHYALDEGGGEPGLLYARKRDPIGHVLPKVHEAFVGALAACALLEDEPTLGGAVFRGDRARVCIASRLVAQNDAASMEALGPALDGFLVEAYGPAGATVTQVGDTRDMLSVEVRAAEPVTVKALLERLSG